MAKLIFTDSNYSGRVYELTLEKTTVGRSDQNTLVIHDNSLSGLHCEIYLNGPEVIVRDLGSRNGTFVNGLKLQNHQAQLKSGQIVRFGAVEARLELDGPSSNQDDTASDITAVYTLGRIRHEQKWAEQHPKPADPSMKLEPSSPSAESDSTVTAISKVHPKASGSGGAGTSRGPAGEILQNHRYPDCRSAGVGSDHSALVVVGTEQFDRDGAPFALPAEKFAANRPLNFCCTCNKRLTGRDAARKSGLPG